MIRNSLSENEMRERLASYENSEVTDEMYEFGKFLLAEITDRFTKLDTKSTNLAAYAIGIITFLGATSANWINRVHKLLGVPLPVWAGTVAFIATGFAVASLFVRKAEWFSQDEWMQKECLTSRERLRKYRLLTMWGILEEHQKACENKAQRLLIAQRIFTLAAILLFISLLNTVGVF